MITPDFALPVLFLLRGVDAATPPTLVQKSCSSSQKKLLAQTWRQVFRPLYSWFHHQKTTNSYAWAQRAQWCCWNKGWKNKPFRNRVYLFFHEFSWSGSTWILRSENEIKFERLKLDNMVISLERTRVYLELVKEIYSRNGLVSIFPLLPSIRFRGQK